MSRLTAKDVKGIWAGITMSWDEHYGFDEKHYRANIQRAIDAKVHGIYTTGSTGEFYVLEYEEFKRMVEIQAEICGKAKMPLQIGCCADATAKIIRLLECASSHPEVGAVQVTLPYWMELSNRQIQMFFKDLNTACPNMPLLHYNIPRAKRFLQGADYLRILDVAPNLIGVKYTFAGTNFGALQDSLILTENLSYFVGENLLGSAMQLGVRGCYSSLVSTNPRYMLDFYAKAEQRRWDEVIAMQKHIAKFFADTEAFIDARGEDSIDPIFDKGLGVASGCVLGSQRCRAPYYGWSDETVRVLRQWLQEKYPEFVYQG